MNTSAVCIRPATEQDQRAIRLLVRGERLNPTGLDWADFLVAATEEGVVGAVGMCKHADGSRELGSLVVRKDVRGRGIATQLMDALLAAESRPVWMITSAAFAGAYEQWDFRPIETRSAPVNVRHNYRMGNLARLVPFFGRRPMRKLVILERLPA